MPTVHNTHTPPSIGKTAFNCPYCGAFAQQHWHAIQAYELSASEKPTIVTESDVLAAVQELTADSELSARLNVHRLKQLATGRLLFDIRGFERDRRRDVGRVTPVSNLSVSRCYNCKEAAVWKYDRLIWPTETSAPRPNPDLPEDVSAIYAEAGAILNTSPRGAAALLRLAIQILCKHLGAAGQNINDDIKVLVESGIDERVQKALDIVRVVGNHSVHPGKIDMADDSETAMSLFDLVNLVAERTISENKHIDDMFGRLPERDRNAIERRDRK